jgi:DNA invertase Pin-like site-specific DNA recombinase
VTDTDAAARAALHARPGAHIGYARCSAVAQDTEIQRVALAGYGVPADRVYVDEGFTETNIGQPGHDQQRAHLLQLGREGTKAPTELAELLGVSRATIYPELKKAQEAAA